MEELTKIKDLNPNAKRVNVLAKVLHKGEPKEINTRYGETKHVTEAVIGDDTGTIIMSLWNEQADLVAEGETIYVDNGYISLVRGHMRLNVGKYGSIKKSEEEIGDVNEELDMSAEEHERQYQSRHSSYYKRGYGRR